MNKYEMLTIFSASLSDEQKEAIVAKYSKLMEKDGGKVETVSSAAPWGLKKLTYPINYKTEGYYVYMAFEGDCDLVQEMKRVIGIAENVIRRLITKR